MRKTTRRRQIRRYTMAQYRESLNPREHVLAGLTCPIPATRKVPVCPDKWDEAVVRMATADS